jgi:N-acetylglutamate synthase-like GNAT family acetyltransferase
MKEFQGLKFEKLDEKDINTLTPIMERAFNEDSRIHLNKPKGGPEGYDNGEFLRKWGLNKDATSYIITLDDKAVGCIILWINGKTNINMLGCIFIDADIQNRGIGKKVWGFIEQEYQSTVKWVVETPGFSTRNHNFYINKCGFHIVKINNPKDKNESMYIMEKCIKQKYN